MLESKKERGPRRGGEDQEFVAGLCLGFMVYHPFYLRS
jgi:hypothetical protein